MSYYNTINLDKSKLIKALLKADNQMHKVRIIFNSYGMLTASEAHSYFPSNVPLTSIRRAISDLQSEGYLIKTDNMKEGLFGMPEHYYKVNNQLSLF